MFSLSGCTQTVKSEMGITGEDTLLETFDPNSGSNGRWVQQMPSTVRNVERYSALLYRKHGTSSTAEDMAFEIEKLLQRFKSQKRPANFGESTTVSTPSSKKRRAIAEPDWEPLQEKKVRVHPSPASPSPPSPAGNHSEILEGEPDFSLDIDEPLAPPQPAPPLPLASPSLPPAPHTKTLAKKSTKASQNASGSDVDPALEPASRHAHWPLKYVKAMASGFEKMASLKTGKLEDHFAVAFGDLAKFSKPTWNLHSRAWEAASEDLKEQYVEAGYSKNGLWKNFTKEVASSFPDGKIPGKRVIKKNIKEQEDEESD